MASSQAELKCSLRVLRGRERSVDGANRQRWTLRCTFKSQMTFIVIPSASNATPNSYLGCLLPWSHNATGFQKPSLLSMTSNPPPSKVWKPLRSGGVKNGRAGGWEEKRENTIPRRIAWLYFITDGEGFHETPHLLEWMLWLLGKRSHVLQWCGHWWVPTLQ